MSTKNSLQSDAGFTVIELLLAFATAGLIFLVIFLAVPALIRNGHNDQRKQDVAAILNSVSHYELSHSGTYPNGSAADWTTQLNQFTKLSHYEPSGVQINSPSPAGASHTSVADDVVAVYAYYVCDPTTGGATSNGAGYRDIVALYTIEVRGGMAIRCQQL